MWKYQISYKIEKSSEFLFVNLMAIKYGDWFNCACEQPALYVDWEGTWCWQWSVDKCSELRHNCPTVGMPRLLSGTGTPAASCGTRQFMQPVLL
jgi:hypothetical protein